MNTDPADESTEERVSQLAVELSLPPITGNSDRQIAWATEIRNRAAARAIRIMATLDSELASHYVQARPDPAEELRQARALLVAAFAKLTYAPSIIHFRAGLESGSLAIALMHLELVSPDDYHRLDLDTRYGHISRQAQLMMVNLPPTNTSQPHTPHA